MNYDNEYKILGIFHNKQSIVTFFVGVCFTLVGLAGFFITDILSNLGINAFHSTAQVLSGLICFAASFYSSGVFAALYNKIFGIFFVTQSSAFFAFPEILSKYLQFQTPEAIFTLTLGSILLIAGFGGSFFTKYREEKLKYSFKDYFYSTHSWRFINDREHAALDYTASVLLVFTPLLGGFYEKTIIGFFVPIILGFSLFTYSLMTKYSLGIKMLISYKIHMIIDSIAAIILMFLPIIFGFEGLEKWFLFSMGIIIAFLVLFSSPKIEDNLSKTTFL